MKLCGPWRSRLQLMGDYILSHVLFALPRSIVNRERQITTKSGIKISYRLNRGDLQGIREVWCDEVYRLPFAAPAGAFLDLGANIGLTTVWMATHNQFSRIIAIEPDCENATLATKNIQQNGIPGEVLQAAVGPSDGTVCFQKAAWSNLGHVGEEGTPVRAVCVSSLLNELGLDGFGLVKVDIEGGEQALFLGPSEWLRHTGAMVVEFHPNMVDYPLLTKTVASQGFEYIPASPRNMDCFLRIAAN
jgi:FkbM family methyltransferase